MIKKTASQPTVDEKTLLATILGDIEELYRTTYGPRSTPQTWLPSSTLQYPTPMHSPMSENYAPYHSPRGQGSFSPREPEFCPGYQRSMSEYNPTSPAYTNTAASPAYSHTAQSPVYNPISPAYSPSAPYTPAYGPYSPAYTPTSPMHNPKSPAYNPNSPAYSPIYAASPAYNPSSPAYSPTRSPTSPAYTPAYSPTSPAYSSASPACSPNSPAYSPTYVYIFACAVYITVGESISAHYSTSVYRQNTQMAYI